MNESPAISRWVGYPLVLAAERQLVEQLCIVQKGKVVRLTHLGRREKTRSERELRMALWFRMHVLIGQIAALLTTCNNQQMWADVLKTKQL